MPDGEVKYETKVVHAIRGMEPRSIRKWESEGWELVRQTSGMLRTEITFRRPSRRAPRLAWILGGGAVAIVLAVVIILGVAGERNAGSPPGSTGSQSESPQLPIVSPSAEDPIADSSPSSQSFPLTPENDEDLAALLALGDYCDPSIAVFAEEHRSQTIAFAGNIGAIGPHGDSSTRYDILIGAGEFSETSASGPAFQFRDVNTTNDLNYLNAPPDTIGVGTNLDVTAKIDVYEEGSCLLLLEPVSISFK